jgi:S1-C subfamily serine protease
VISNNGHVVTNHHVIDGCVGDISGSLSGEAAIKLRQVSSDETNDLALLQAPGPFKEMATIRGSGVRSGDAVVAIGYPYHGLLSSDFTVTTGIVSSLSGLYNDTRHLQISAAARCATSSTTARCPIRPRMQSPHQAPGSWRPPKSPRTREALRC